MLTCLFALGAVCGLIPCEGASALFFYAGLWPSRFFFTRIACHGSLRATAEDGSCRWSFVDCAGWFWTMLGLMLTCHVPITSRLAFAPLFVCGISIAAFGVDALWTRLALSRLRRGHAITGLLSLGMVASPLMFPLSAVPDEYRLLYAFNPLVGMIGGLRWAFLGHPLEVGCLLASCGAAAALLFLGLVRNATGCHGNCTKAPGPRGRR